MQKSSTRIAAWKQAAPESNLATGGFPVFKEGRYERRPSLWLDQAHDLLQWFGLRIAGPNPMQREIKPTADQSEQTALHSQEAKALCAVVAATLNARRTPESKRK